MLKNKLFRCSSLHLIIGQSKTKGEVLSQTAKSAIREMVKHDLYGFSSFKGSKYTNKGLAMEDLAIKLVGDLSFRVYEKNTLRVENKLLTGEADIIDVLDRKILDTKCTWDIGTHPFFKEEALEKVKKSGYDVQLHGYMMLYSEKLGVDFNKGEVKFCLFPTPDELIGRFDDHSSLVEKVNAIPLEKRITTVIVERDQSIIDRINEVIPHAQRYYKKLQLELIGYE